MFTGIIEELGKISALVPISGGLRISISGKKIMDDLKVDDSVSVNGICLTVVDLEKESFSAEAVGDTLAKTNLSRYRVGQRVNLERALTLQTRLGGHIVQGHVNFISRILNLEKKGKSWQLKIDIPEDQMKYCIVEGSIAVDGISFTIAELQPGNASINLIPHTYEKTNIQDLHPGDYVNIEVDVIGKYIENLFIKKSNDNQGSVESWLSNLGWE